jgi:hypothetical protein
MIEIYIEVPHTTMMCMTPKMILGNYVTSDSRVRRIECDRLMGYCTTEVQVQDDLNRQISHYVIRANYTDLEAEMLTKLIL